MINFNNSNNLNISNKPQKSFNGNGVSTVKGSETSAKIFTNNIEKEALDQIKELCDTPVFRDVPIRIMPDVSACKGCVVGLSAKLPKERIKDLSPGVIGNDIGCGVLLVKTDTKVNEIDFEKLDNFIKHELNSNRKLRPEMSVELKQGIKEACDLYQKDSSIVMDQSGTLGNGNHFIEVDKDEQDNVYLAIHTGSRQFGSFIKEYYEKAKDTSDMSYSEAVAFAQKYAKNNRSSIAQMILRKMNMKPTMMYDVPHNYIAENGTVHKGSIDASLGTPVLIPLNMRDGIVLGTGKGNEDWNCTAPHGSGRKMSRYEARNKVDLNEFVKSMSGIYSSCVNKRTLDESPQAYKDSTEILDLISNTVNIDKIIKPVYNYKHA